MRAALRLRQTPAAQPCVRSNTRRAVPVAVVTGPQAGKIAQLPDFLWAEAELGLPKLGELAPGAEPGQRERRIDAAGDRDRPALGQDVDQHAQEVEDSRIAGAMHVVQRQHAMRDRNRLQHRRELAHCRAQATRLLGRTGQCFGRRSPGRVVGLQRFRQALQKAGQVVILVDSHPRGRAAGRQKLELARQGGSLAIACRRRQQNQPPTEQGRAEAAFELAAFDQPDSETGG